MRRKRYDPKVKAAIREAVVAARKSDKTWVESLEVAKGVGYRGTLGGIQQLLRKSAGKRRGRPKGKRVAAASSVSPVQQMVDRLVRDQVRAAIGKAIAALRQI